MSIADLQVVNQTTRIIDLQAVVHLLEGLKPQDTQNHL